MDMELMQKIVEAETVEDRMALVEANKTELTGEADSTALDDLTTENQRLAGEVASQKKLYRDTFFSGAGEQQQRLAEEEKETAPINLEMMGL